MAQQETEVKLRIGNRAGIRRRLRLLGFRLHRRRSLEDNTVMDTPDGSLRQQRCLLRLRHYGRRCLLTFKGPPAQDRFYKSRPESQTEVDNLAAARRILERLGFRPVFRYQKFRTQFWLGRPDHGTAAGLEASLDETPIGNFLELEGSRAAIDRVARSLGYAKRDYVTASYRALYLDDCRKRNRTPGDMLFPSSPSPHKVRRGSRD